MAFRSVKETPPIVPDFYVIFRMKRLWLNEKEEICFL